MVYLFIEMYEYEYAECNGEVRKIKSTLNLHSRSCSWALLAKVKEGLNSTVYGPQKPSLKYAMKILPRSLQGPHHLLNKGSNVPEKLPGAHLPYDISSIFKVL